MNRNVRSVLVAGLLGIVMAVGLTASAAEPKSSPGPGSSGPVKYVPRPDAILVTEGFEAAVPPASWTLQATHTGLYTWSTSATSPHAGAASASVEYDPALVPQNEWLLSPALNLATGPTTLSFWSAGSVYWCRDTYNNCNLEVWLVVDAVGGADDVLLGLADTSWVTNWTWAQTTFDLTGQMPRNARIGFRYTGTDGAQVKLDDVTVDGTLLPVGLQEFTVN